jgi:putative hydrolase of the HAD superfamily
VSKPVRAIVFDFGGVLITPITTKITALAERAGVPVPTMLEVLMGPMTVSTPDHPWHRSERGEIPTAEIQGLLGPYAERNGVKLRGDEMALIFEGNYVYNDAVLARITELRAEGYRIGLLTNSVREFRPRLDAELGNGLFDEIIDSSEVGCRKPEPAIYELTTRRMGVERDELVYLDDFGGNVTGARLHGWTTIHVTGPDQALAELDTVLATR